MKHYRYSKYITKYEQLRKFYKIERINIDFKMNIEQVKNITEELREQGYDYTVPQWLGEISNFNTVVLFNVIKECVIIEDYPIETIIANLAFDDVLTVVTKLLEKCMPIAKEKDNDSLFEDEEEEIEDEIDWDFDYMLYLWNSILNRNDSMWNITPKTFFRQIELAKEQNEKQNQERVEEI